MADLKISALTSATTPLAGTEVLPMVQSSTTVKVATNDLTVRNVRANATTGILQVTGPGTGTTRVMTTPDANFSAARIDAAQTFVGNQTFSDSTIDVSVAGTASYSPTAAPTYNLGLFTTGAANSRYTSFAINSRGTSGQGQTSYITCVPGASDGDASLRFSTYGGYGVSEALNLTKDQDVSVTKGNLVIGTSGKGIDFSATSHPASMTSELLNDYEEGTWTPVGTWTVPGTGSTSVAYANYTKVGRLVTINTYFSPNTGTATGTFTTTGLPFATVGAVGFCGLTVGIGAIGKIITMNVNPGSTTINFNLQDQATTYGGPVTATEMPLTDSYIQITFSYAI